MRSPYFDEDHQAFRESARKFMENEVAPHADEWERNREIPREIFVQMGELGFLGVNFPEKYGGSDLDFFFSVVWIEELSRSTMGGFNAAVSVHQYMATEYLQRYASDQLKDRFLPDAVAGRQVGALAVSEPNTGSDVAAIRTRAVRDNDDYVINGNKTFITNGVYGNYVIVACKTEPDRGTSGTTLILVEKGTPGFTARKMEKMGLHSSDTGELSFEDVRVPVENRVGEEGMGFYYIMECFQLERLVASVGAVGGSQICLEQTLQYVQERQAFGRPIAKFQVIRHTLAQLASELEAARALTYHTCWLHDQGEHAVELCSMAKLITAELAIKIGDECLQCYGGYGYMEEYPVARHYRDARAGTIAGGTSQIMREIIAKMVIDKVRYSRRDADPKGDADRSLPSSVAEVFAQLPERFRKEKAGDYETTFHFDITGPAGGQYTVRIAGGNCAVDDGLQGEAKCVVEADDQTYLDVELGRADPQAAVMSGAVKVSNLGEMMQFARVFRRLSA